MDAKFTLPYSEYEVINILNTELKKKSGNSIYIPVSRQETGVDFLIHNHKTKKILKVQVKSSRSYHELPKELKSGVIRDVKYKYHLWFPNFINKCKKGTADLYILFGLYPIYSQGKRINSKSSIWYPIVLCFFEDEMIKVLKGAKTKKEKKQEKFIDFGFNDQNVIYGTRGFKNITDMSKFLLKNKLKEVGDFLNKK